MQLTVIPVTPYQQNCSLLICEQSGRAALIDPGGEPDRLLQELSKIDAEVEKILVTHSHFDHAGAVAEMAERLFPLGDEVRFLPGHGPMSTFGDERHNNPFVSDKRWG